MLECLNAPMKQQGARQIHQDDSAVLFLESHAFIHARLHTMQMHMTGSSGRCYRDTPKVRSAQSAPPLASRRGPAQDTASALSVCAASVCSGTAPRRSHSLTLRSNEAVARWCAELGCHAADVTQSLCEANARLACFSKPGFRDHGTGHAGLSVCMPLAATTSYDTSTW